MANLKDFRREVKINFAQTLCRFEGINLTDFQTEKLLNNDNFAMLDFPEDESLIINNVINTLNYMEFELKTADGLSITNQLADSDFMVCAQIVQYAKHK